MIRLIIREELEGHVSHNFPHNSHQPSSTTVHVAPQESLVPGLRDLNIDEPAVNKSDPLYKADHSCTSPAASVSTLPDHASVDAANARGAILRGRGSHFCGLQLRSLIPSGALYRRFVTTVASGAIYHIFVDGASRTSDIVTL